LAATRSWGGAKEPAIALRINPSVEAETHHHIATGGHRSKFGIDLTEAQMILAAADRCSHLDIAGLHIHIGSQLASPDRTIEAVQRVLELTRFHPIRMLDIGGGFPVAYRPGDQFPEPAVFADALRPSLKDQSFEIAIEPGRSIIADAGALVAEVQYVKQREGRRIIVTDASMTELIRPALYEAYHHIVAIDRPVTAENIELEGTSSISASSAAKPWPADVVGPVCESADVLGRDRSLPEVQRGDRLLILATGAYGSAMASNYNSRPRPAEVLVEGSTCRLIRRRETWEDLVALEQ
ncbi:MAG TPA: diaminopimelate decarboxylase, partial [Anaerolineae bacterium]